MRSILSLLLLVAASAPAWAQSEDQLRSYFEGRSVVVKLEMPGTEDGVDVFPASPQPIDFPRHASRLKRFGTALRRGDEVTITKVKVKKDLIEFQLGGGGYGTFGDDTDSDVGVATAAKTQREKNLEADIKRTTDPATRRRMQEELDALRRSRERADARNRAEAAQAKQIKEANIRQRRAEGGSRFNLRYKPEVPGDALTPESVMDALRDYVDFGPLGPARPAQLASVMPAGGDGLRKGLTLEEVDALLGRPESITQRAEGTLTVSTSTYRNAARRVSAEFVEGVLVRFTITSP
jgi:hypothetical protein